MKRTYMNLLALVLVLTMLCGSVAAADALYTPGTYTATEFGMMGDVVVRKIMSEKSLVRE